MCKYLYKAPFYFLEVFLKLVFTYVIDLYSVSYTYNCNLLIYIIIYLTLVLASHFQGAVFPSLIPASAFVVDFQIAAAVGS